jgi:hypothetical protein
MSQFRMVLSLERDLGHLCITFVFLTDQSGITEWEEFF